jgi:hypothetical protein
LRVSILRGYINPPQRYGLLLTAIADCESWLKLLDVLSQSSLQITLKPERSIDCIGNFDLFLDILLVGFHSDVGLDSCDCASRYADTRSDILSIEALLEGRYDGLPLLQRYRHRGFLPLIALNHFAAVSSIGGGGGSSSDAP